MLLSNKINALDQPIDRQRLLQEIAGEVLASSDPLLDAISRVVAKTFGAACAIVTSAFSPKHPAERYGCFDVRDRDLPVTFAIEATPCEQVITRNEPFVCNGEARAKFPGDSVLQDMGIESYVGVPLLDNDGACIGVFYLLFEAPFDPSYEPLITHTMINLAPRLATDVKERKELLRFEGAASCAAGGLWVADLIEGQLSYSDRALKLINIDEAKQPTSISQLFYWLDAQSNAQLESALIAHIETGAQFDLTIQCGAEAEAGRWFRVAGAATTDDRGVPLQVSGSILDVTHFIEERQHAVWMASQLERARVEAENEALHDALTGLPNRRHLDARLEQIVSQALPGQMVSLLQIDLDRFKQINDTLGHAAGDHVLVEVAERLRSSLRSSDFVARIGGDEFVVLCDNSAKAGLRKLGEKIVSACAKPVTYEGHLCEFGASVGIVSVPSTMAREAMLKADAALYDAKENGRGRVSFFSTNAKTTSSAA